MAGSPRPQPDRTTAAWPHHRRPSRNPHPGQPMPPPARDGAARPTYFAEDFTKRRPADLVALVAHQECSSRRRRRPVASLLPSGTWPCYWHQRARDRRDITTRAAAELRRDLDGNPDHLAIYGALWLVAPSPGPATVTRAPGSLEIMQHLPLRPLAKATAVDCVRPNKKPLPRSASRWRPERPKRCVSPTPRHRHRPSIERGRHSA
jgi:hypothetical protein